MSHWLPFLFLYLDYLWRATNVTADKQRLQEKHSAYFSLLLVRYRSQDRKSIRWLLIFSFTQTFPSLVQWQSVRPSHRLNLGLWARCSLCYGDHLIDYQLYSHALLNTKPKKQKQRKISPLSKPIHDSKDQCYATPHTILGHTRRSTDALTPALLVIPLNKFCTRLTPNDFIGMRRLPAAGLIYMYR